MTESGLRRAIAASTRERHERLHVHPLFARLLGPALDPADYGAALEVFRAAFGGLESIRSRLGVWPRFSLARQVEALGLDLQQLELERRECLSTSHDTAHDTHVALRDADACLGALYVLHGSSFGAQVLRDAIARSLPSAPRAFLGLRPDPGAWAALTEELARPERSEASVAGLFEGAHAMFAFVEEQADQRLGNAALDGPQRPANAAHRVG